MTDKPAQASLATALNHAADVLALVMDRGRSLTDAIPLLEPPALRAAVQDIAYTAVRQWARTSLLVHWLTEGRALKPPALGYLLATALALACDPTRQRYPSHTLVSQAVTAAAQRKSTQPGKGLLNACLRRYFRERDALEAALLKDESARWGFPSWWIRQLRKQQPDAWQAILASADEPPALTLRVNRRRTTVAAFVQACLDAGLEAQAISGDAVWLPQPVPVFRIPGFAQGHVSVQDLGAQWAAPLLDAKEGMRVLDACCAPGGKTGHLLELADIELLALDIDDRRLQRVQDNLDRLGLDGPSVRLQAANVVDRDSWWDGRFFDAILADVPCSASGVVRRHPDIRWLRRPEDVAAMSQLQGNLLDVLWSVLRPGGTLLLVTCSIFGEEGAHLLERFLGQHPDAVVLPSPGLVLPSVQAQGPGHDGFFYARLQKDALAHA